MTGLAIGLIKARDEISEVVVVVVVGVWFFCFFLADKTFRTQLLDTFVLVFLLLFLFLVLVFLFYLSRHKKGARPL